MSIAHLFYYPKQVRSASVCSYQWKINNPIWEAEYDSSIVDEIEALAKEMYNCIIDHSKKKRHIFSLTPIKINMHQILPIVYPYHQHMGELYTF